MTSPFTGTYRAIWGTSDTDIFAVGDFGTIEHYDGKKWVKQNSSSSRHLSDVWGTSPTNVYAVGEVDTTSQPYKTTLLHYNGMQWSHVNTGLSAYSLHAIHGTAANRIWAVGGATVVMYFNGAKWTKTDVGVTGWHRTVFALNNSNVWLGGDAASMYNFDGTKWNLSTTGSPKAQIFYGLWGTNNKYLWAVGGNSRAMMRFDGTKWNTLISTGTMYGIHGSGVNNIYAVGNSGTIRHFDGKTWTKEPVITNSNLSGVWVSPSGKVYAVGSLGEIIQKQ